MKQIELIIDVGVLVEWHSLAELERNDGVNIESVDMQQLFWIAISFIIVYRFLLACFGANEGYDYANKWIKSNDNKNYSRGIKIMIKICLTLIGFIGGTLELLVFYAIILDQKDNFSLTNKNNTNNTSNNNNSNNNSQHQQNIQDVGVYGAGLGQKVFQLAEGVGESLPEVILQSVFLIRSNNDKYLLSIENESGIRELIILSILASILSIANKYVWIDELSLITPCQSFLVKQATAKSAAIINILPRLEELKLLKDSYDSGMFALALGQVIIDGEITNVNQLNLPNLNSKQLLSDKKIIKAIKVDIVYRTHDNDTKKQDCRDTKKAIEQMVSDKNKYSDLIQHVIDVINSDENENYPWLHKIICNCCTKSNYYVSIGYIIRLIWRFAAVTSRFVLFSLIWVVLGGWFLAIMGPIMIVLWYVLVFCFVSVQYNKYKRGKYVGSHGFNYVSSQGFNFVDANISISIEHDGLLGCCWVWTKAFFVVIFYVIVLLLAGFVFQLGIFFISGKGLYVIRMIENVLVMCVITLFAFDQSIDCDICADPVTRSPMKNTRIMTWMIIGWVSIVVHVVCSIFVSKMINKYYWLRMESIYENEEQKMADMDAISESQNEKK